MNLGRIFYCALLAGGLSACATQSVQYYTLLPVSMSDTPAGSHHGASSKFAISVQPVTLPEQVDRPQIVISDPDTTQVTPLNSALWASPLSDEIRNALSNELSRRLGVLDIAASGAPDALPLWKISLRVQRFESIYNQRAVLDVTWRLTPVNQRGRKTMICRAEAQVPVEAGMSAMVVGHQEALQRMAAVIAAQLLQPGTQPRVAGVDQKGCTL